MAGLPEYRDTVNLGSPAAPALQPQAAMPQPYTPDLSGPGRGLSGLGEELGRVAAKLEEGAQNTAASQAMEGFLQQRMKLQQQYVQDQDYASAEQRFIQDIGEAQQEALGRISNPQLRAKASLEMTRDVIASQGRVRTAQLGRQGDINKAALDTFKQASMTDAIGAASPAEELSAIQRYAGEVDRNVKAGWIDATEAVKRGLDFRNELDTAKAMRLVQSNPDAARLALNDPKQFPGIDPTKRAGFIIAAEQKSDSDRQTMLTTLAGFHPQAASLAVGRITSPGDAQKIFDTGIVAIESDNKPGVVSEKGALGLSQIMPATAREVAKGLGLNDVAALDDAALKERLLADSQLNLRLGRTYWSQLVTRYDGNLSLAAVAYNAGPGRADEWKAKAEAKFGANFSAAQLQSVVDIKESRDYLSKLYGRFNAPLDVQFSSPAAAVRAAQGVGTVLAQAQARENHILSVQASTAAATDDVTSILKLGFDADPARVASWKATQQTAAESGDAAAAGRLRDLETAQRLAPFVRQAWATPPQMLDTAVKNMEAALTGTGANPSTDQVNAVKAFRAVRDEQIRVRDAEPVVLGGQNGGRYYALQPLDPRAGLDDGLTAALKNRDAQAIAAHTLYGGTGSPFTVQEADAWRQRYQEATPQERAALLGAFAKGLSPQTFAAAMPQITGDRVKDHAPVLTAAAGIYAQAPEIAQSILQGLEAMDADKRYAPKGAGNVLAYQTSLDQYLPAAAFNKAARMDPQGPFVAMQAAIEARYAFLSAQAKDVTGVPNTSRLQQAVNDVTGGVLWHNSAPVVAPSRGMSQAQFDGIVWGLKDADLEGVRTSGGSRIDAEYLRRSARLVSFGDGRYLVQVNRDDANPQYAAGGDGGPFILDLRGRSAPERGPEILPSDIPVPLL